MRALLLELEVGGQARRYTTAPEPQTIGADTYVPGLDLASVAVFELTQTTAIITDPAVDWPAILLGSGGPPVWPARIYWTSGDGVAYPLQVGLASVDAAGLPAWVLSISIDSAMAAGVKLIPDPASAVQPDSYPVSASGPTATIWAQHEPTVGAIPPLVYGIPGNAAKGLYSGQGIPGPATPAYLVELGQGALDQGYGTLEIANGPIAATRVKVFDVSAGYTRTKWMEAPVNVAYMLDATGRPRTVAKIDGTIVAVDLLATAGSEYWCSFYSDSGGGVADPLTGLTMRDASLIVPDLLRRCGYPVDTGRGGSLAGYTLDFSITEPADALDWITQHLGGLPLNVYRSGAGFYADIEPLDSAAAGLAVRLGSQASIGDTLSWAAPASVASEVVIDYAPIRGQPARSERLTATAQPGARASVLCALAAARGLSFVAQVALPAVYDVATAGRAADLVALDRCSAGPYGQIETGDLELLQSLLLQGPLAILTIDETDSAEAMGLQGRRCYVRSMTCSPAGLSMAVRFLREAAI